MEEINEYEKQEQKNGITEEERKMADEIMEKLRATREEIENDKIEEKTEEIEAICSEPDTDKNDDKRLEDEVMDGSMETQEFNEEEILKKEDASILAGVEKWGKLRRRTLIGCLSLSLLSGLAGGYISTLLARPNNTVVYVEKEETENKINDISKTGEQNINKLTTTEIAKKASETVVEINVTSTEESFFGQYQVAGAGSGVVITNDGYILTNEHVVEGAEDIKVIMPDGNEYSANIAGADAKTDIAVIKVESEEQFTSAVIGNSDNLEVGEYVMAVGNPLGTLGGTVTDGIISAINRQVTINNVTMDLIQTNAAINNGNSGGGLFDSNGRLIGIVNMKDSGFTSSGATIEGLGFAIPINKAMEIAEQLIEDGYVSSRAELGVYLQELEEQYLIYEPGLYITQVIEGSTAEDAGLKVGDRILRFNGKDIESYTDLYTEIENVKAGDEVEIVIQRNEEAISKIITMKPVGKD